MIITDLPPVQPVAGESERARSDGAIYLRIRAISGDNYEIEGERTPDDRYAELKAALDKKFERMFQLKQELDKTSAETQAKWDEYYALSQAYEKALKRIIAVWVTDNADSIPDRIRPNAHFAR